MTLIVNISAPRPEVNSKVHETLALTMDENMAITRKPSSIFEYKFYYIIIQRVLKFDFLFLKAFFHVFFITQMAKTARMRILV